MGPPLSQAEASTGTEGREFAIRTQGGVGGGWAPAEPGELPGSVSAGLGLLVKTPSLKLTSIRQNWKG